jgi:hypothetical protein
LARTLFDAESAFECAFLRRRRALAPAGDGTQFGCSSAGFGGSQIFSRAFSRLDLPAIAQQESADPD